MIMEIFCLGAVIGVSVLFFLQEKDPVESENVTETSVSNSAAHQRLGGPPIISKEVIVAMAQKNIYQLVERTNDECDGGAVIEGDDDRWTDDVIYSSCVKLDTHRTNVTELERIVHSFCDRVEKLIDIYQANLCEYNEALAYITDVRLSVEEQIFRLKSACEGKSQAPPAGTMIDNNCRHDEKTLAVNGTPKKCPAVTGNSTDDDLLLVYGQFIDGDLEAFVDVRNCAEIHKPSPTTDVSSANDGVLNSELLK